MCSGISRTKVYMNGSNVATKYTWMDQGMCGISATQVYMNGSSVARNMRGGKTDIS